ncbi:MAG: GOLPH3/VPS74 family protein [Nocardioidaceae bacterium]
MAVEPPPRPALDLAQAVLLLALGMHGGATPQAIERTLAGAVLIELIDRGCLFDDGGRLVPSSCGAPDDELLADALALLRSSVRPREAPWWIERLPRQLAPLRERVARPLVERGIVPHERSRFTGPYGGMRFPAHDREPERQLRARLAPVLLGERDPFPWEATLIALLRAHGLERDAVPEERRGAAARRASEIAAEAELGAATWTVVRALEGDASAARSSPG